MIPEKGRHTVCISTQVGCPMACKFCATGLLGIKRNLKAREIAEQVFVAARDIAPERVSNVVVMGMGEPLLNYEATLGALKVLNDPEGSAWRRGTSRSRRVGWWTRSGVSPTSRSSSTWRSRCTPPSRTSGGRSCPSPPVTRSPS